MTYFEEVSKYPILPHEELMQLFRDLVRHESDAWAASGRTREEDPHGTVIREHGKSSAKVRAHLFLADKCVEVIVQSNLKLVISSAGKAAKVGGLSQEDLTQEGNIGLMRAIRTFDPEKGFRFSTYALWWVRHYINRALSNQGREIRLPVHTLELLRSIKNAKKELAPKLNRKPTKLEIAEHLGVPLKRVEEVLMSSLTASPLPLNDHLSERGDEWIDMIPSDQEDPDVLLEREEGKAAIHEALKKLPPIQYRVLARRFGIGKKDEMTLKEIGDEEDLSRQRIQQIEAEALRNMKRALKKVVK